MTVADALSRAGASRHIAGSFRIRCPWHRGHDFNCSVLETKTGAAWFTCFSKGCKSTDIEAALSGYAVTQSYSEFKQAGALTAAQRIEKAREIWDASVPAAGTLVETYLAGRGITIAPPLSIRFHPGLWHKEGAAELPVMVAGVQAVDGRIVGVHRTFLSRSGERKEDVLPNKMMLGVCAAGAVRLARAADTLVVAEGLETSLSVSQATGLPTWCALSTSGLATIRLPTIVKTVFLAIDHDRSGAGDAAAMRACDRFLAMGLGVRIARPDRAGTDFNDMLRE